MSDIPLGSLTYPQLLNAAMTLRAELDKAREESRGIQATLAKVHSQLVERDAELRKIRDDAFDNTKTCGESSCEECNNRVAYLRQQLTLAREELAEAQKDQGRLDWLEKWLEQGRFISEPTKASPGWELGYPAEHAYHIEGGGDTLREAIDSAKATTQSTKEAK